LGTRADFYVERGEDAEWLGSIAWDGYPSGLSRDESGVKDDPVLTATTEPVYREEVDKLLARREDATRPEQGWPWPWTDSQTTDFAYTFDGGKVWMSIFGRPWADPLEWNFEKDYPDTDERVPFPNMEDRQAVTFGRRSGVIIVGGPLPPDQPLPRKD
jgi:hypothetical protein